MKATPPSLASATASLSSDTACMMADTMGIFMDRAGSSPFLYLTSGVLRLTLAGVQSQLEYPGTSRYSLKVRDGSLKMWAMVIPPCKISCRHIMRELYHTVRQN